MTASCEYRQTTHLVRPDLVCHPAVVASGISLGYATIRKFSCVLKNNNTTTAREISYTFITSRAPYVGVAVNPPSLGDGSAVIIFCYCLVAILTCIRLSVASQMNSVYAQHTLGTMSAASGISDQRRCLCFISPSLFVSLTSPASAMLVFSASASLAACTTHPHTTHIITQYQSILTMLHYSRLAAWNACSANQLDVFLLHDAMCK